MQGDNVRAEKELFEGNEPLQKVANETYYKIPLEQLQRIATSLARDYNADLVTMIALDEREQLDAYTLIYVFSFSADDCFICLSVSVPAENPVFPSLTPFLNSAHWYEREAQDMFGLKAKGHPDPRPLVLHDVWSEDSYPLRKDFGKKSGNKNKAKKLHYDFLRVHGEGVFEVPVGPIHAGVIEPGHFRFSVLGESILYLEARVFYTHRGVEKLCEGKNYEEVLYVVERICGVCAFSHSVSYVSAIERLAGVTIPERAQYLRTIFLELERLYNHIGDISNICAGVGFNFGISQMAVLKERLQELNEKLTGSRFLRGYCIPGGVRYDLKGEEVKLLKETLANVEKEYLEMLEIILGHEFFVSRMTGTGILSYVYAKNLGAVGPAAKASGLLKDVRKEHPHLAYSEMYFEVPLFGKGDVDCRFRVRLEEVKYSFSIIAQCLSKLSSGKIRVAMPNLPNGGFALGYSESPRGDNYHWVKIGPDNTIDRIRIRSASYCNWPAVAVSVPGNMIPDFPLINKSFELCYSCCDR